VATDTNPHAGFVNDGVAADPSEGVAAPVGGHSSRVAELA